MMNQSWVEAGYAISQLISADRPFLRALDHDVWTVRSTGCQDVHPGYYSSNQNTRYREQMYIFEYEYLERKFSQRIEYDIHIIFNNQIYTDQ